VTPDAPWVIESYVGQLGWSTSRLNKDAFTHTLDWCLSEWQLFRGGLTDDKLATEKHLYRLRNVKTDDVIMCAIL